MQVCHGLNRSMLLFQLAAPLSFLSLDTVSLGRRKHLLILNSQLTSLKIHVIHGVNHLLRILRILEVGKGQAPKDAIIEVVVEGIRYGEAEFLHEILELLLLDGKGDILDDDGRRDQLFGLGLATAVVTKKGRRRRVTIVCLSYMRSVMVHASEAAGEAIQRRIGMHGRKLRRKGGRVNPRL